MPGHLFNKPAYRHAMMLVLVLAAFAAAYCKVARHPSPAIFQMPETISLPAVKAPGISTHFVSTTHNNHKHAASLVELGDGRVRAFWFEGSREGARDVEVRTAVLDPVKDQWEKESSAVNREITQRGLLRYVRKLGNPVAARAPDGTLWLFYVTVSLGGWAGSSITAITSRDDGATWSTAKRLITSPFINISTLVKGTPYYYSDGSLGVPVYHEFLGKFGELLRLSKNGEVLDKQRLSSGKTTLQPVMLIKDAQQATALMRYAGAPPGRVVAVSTSDAGQHWSAPEKSRLANPNAALSGVVLPGGQMLIALNDIEAGRDALSLVISNDGGAHWKTVYPLEDMRGQKSDPENFMALAARSALITDKTIADGTPYADSARRVKCAAQNCDFEFSYPYMIQARNGEFHLVYTWNRSYIKHVRFTPAWLDQQQKKAADAELH